MSDRYNRSSLMVSDDSGALSIVIPTLNEAGTIEQVLRSIPARYAGAVLVVDGGSTDGTVGIVQSLGFRLIRQDGRGLGDAIRSGVSHSGGDIVVTLDGDGAHNGTHVAQLLDKLHEGYDLVVASRMSNAPEQVGTFSRRRRSTEQQGLIRDFGNRFFTAICRGMFGVPLHDVLNGCKAFRRDVFTSARLRRDGQEHDVELVLAAQRAGCRIADVPIQQGPRLAGASKLNAFRHGLTILMVIADALVRSRWPPSAPYMPGVSSDGKSDPRSQPADAHLRSGSGSRATSVTNL